MTLLLNTLVNVVSSVYQILQAVRLQKLFNLFISAVLALVVQSFLVGGARP